MQSCTVIFCLVVCFFFFSCFNDSNPDIGKKKKRGNERKAEKRGKQFIPVPMVTVK